MKNSYRIALNKALNGVEHHKRKAQSIGEFDTNSIMTNGPINEDMNGNGIPDYLERVSTTPMVSPTNYNLSSGPIRPNPDGSNALRIDLGEGPATNSQRGAVDPPLPTPRPGKGAYDVDKGDFGTKGDGGFRYGAAKVGKETYMQALKQFKKGGSKK